MLDPHRLNVFRSVVASGSIQAAADNLGLTASAVSQHLSALAKETGLVLFERSGRRIVPTTVARLLAERTRVMTADSQAAKSDDPYALSLIDNRPGKVLVAPIGIPPEADPS